MESAALYLRLSVEDLEKEGGGSQSIQNQRLLLLNFAQKKHWKVVGVYIDENFSGMDSERPAFQRLIADAQAGKFHIIICKTQSRFTRDMEMVERYIHGKFLEWGIRFVSVVDQVDTEYQGNKKARQINGLVNQWYCEDLSENIRAVFRRKMEAGQFIGSFAPFGYRKEDGDRHHLVVDMQAAVVVKEIFRMYLNGYGLYAISRMLTQKKVPTPSFYKYGRGEPYYNPKAPNGSVIWSPGSVGRILKNEVYTGVITQGKERKVSYKSKKVVAVPKYQWIRIENCHEAIIDKKTFETVQKLLCARRRLQKKDSLSPISFLGGKIFCHDCGSVMQKTASTHDRTSFYLRCGKNRRTGLCTSHNSRLSEIEKIVEQRIQEKIGLLLINDKIRNKIVRICEKEEDRKEKQEFFSEDILQKAFADAYMDRAAGRLPEQAFIRLVEKLKNMEAARKREEEQKKCGKKDYGEWLKSAEKNLYCLPALVSIFLNRVEVGENTEGVQKIYLFWN